MSASNQSYNEARFEDVVYTYLGGSETEGIPASRLYQASKLTDFDLANGLHRADLARFLQASQPLEWKKLTKQFPGREMDAVAEEFGRLRTKRNTLDLLRRGFSLAGANLSLVAFKPSGSNNPEHRRRYEQNRFTIARQFHYSQQERSKSLDLVILINGIPIITLELKNEFTNQNVQHAIEQYATDRDPNNPFLRACLVHFAVDNRTVFFCSKLASTSSRFFPFNRDTHNPEIPGKFASSYLWEDILQADTLLTLLQSYVHYENDALIFPRYHQLDVVRELLGKVREQGAGHNYLIQHSAGSGKSNSIAWLAHQLANLYQKEGDAAPLFDSILVITDRRVLDKQLQNTIKQFEKNPGTVRKIDKNAKQLLTALENGDKIIISTLQKFGFIEKLDKGKLSGKRFAIIVDEAHSSQTGENVKDLKGSLTTEEALKAYMDDGEERTFEDALTEALEKDMAGRQQLPHLSFFAFTATPKEKTLRLFGIPDSNTKSGYKAFHHYTMRQAIEEGFIFDVLRNYTTFKSYFELIENEKAEPGRQFEELKTKRLLLRAVSLHPYSIQNKAHIMLDHFADKTVHKIDGQAKAMVVTASRPHAVLYKQAFDALMQEQKLPFKSLVAFSGTVPINEVKYTEEGMNGPKVKDIADAFSGPEYRLLIVANKFQTGFDQPLLHTMYVDKKLGGISAVQTLSRLNRKGLPAKIDTMVLDFAKEQNDIRDAFQEYYQRTDLEEGPNPQRLYNLRYDIQAMEVFTDANVLRFGDLFVVQKVSADALSPFLQRIVDAGYRPLEAADKEKFRKLVDKYVRQYTFLSQVITFIDAQLELFYLFSKLLYKYLPYELDTLPLEVTQMVDMDKFRIQEEENGSILLNPEDATVIDSTDDGYKPKTEATTDYLKAIVQDLNETFKIDFTEANKVVNGLKDKLLNDASLRQSFEANNIDDVKRLMLKESIEKAFLANVDDYLGLMTKIEKEPALEKFFMSRMFQWFNQTMQDKTTTAPISGPMFQGRPIRFYPSNYLSDFANFWQLEAIVGNDIIESTLVEYAGELSESSIQAMINKANRSYYLDANKRFLFSYTSELFEADFGPLTPINGLSALEIYGLQVLEVAREKSYVKL